MTPDLPPALPGKRFEFASAAGRLSVYVAGNGPPLLLVHSVNVAASAAEVRPLHEHYARTRSVFALDLPGFGLSERSDRRYSPRLMTDALHATVEEIRRRCGATPVDAVALSLSGEFLARAASEKPARYRSLALVSPTGFSGSGSFRAATGTTREVPLLYPALRGPGWGAAIYRGLTLPVVIRHFLERTWGTKEIDEALWAYDVVTARQPGARFAPLHFVSGRLFSADIHTVYESLRLPVWLAHGVRGDFTDFRGKKLVAGRPNWTITTFPSGALPFFEVPSEFIADYDAFLRAVELKETPPRSRRRR